MCISFGTQSQNRILNETDKCNAKKRKDEWIKKVENLSQQIKNECDQYDMKLLDSIVPQIEKIKNDLLTQKQQSDEF